MLPGALHHPTAHYGPGSLRRPLVRFLEGLLRGSTRAPRRVPIDSIGSYKGSIKVSKRVL